MGEIGLGRGKRRHNVNWACLSIVCPVLDWVRTLIQSRANGVHLRVMHILSPVYRPPMINLGGGFDFSPANRLFLLAEDERYAYFLTLPKYKKSNSLPLL